MPRWEPNFLDPASDQSPDGIVTPAWTSDLPDSAAFILEQADHPDFQNSVTRYGGPDRKSILTGLPEGTFYFRVRPKDSPDAWSETRQVEVKFIDRQSLFLLVSAGFLTVSAIFLAIFLGWKNERRARS